MADTISVQVANPYDFDHDPSTLSIDQLTALAETNKEPGTLTPAERAVLYKPILFVIRNSGLRTDVVYDLDLDEGRDAINIIATDLDGDSLRIATAVNTGPLYDPETGEPSEGMEERMERFVEITADNLGCLLSEDGATMRRGEEKGWGDLDVRNLPLANPELVQTEFEERTRRFMQHHDGEPLAMGYNPSNGQAMRLESFNQGRDLLALTFRFDQDYDMPHVDPHGDIVVIDHGYYGVPSSGVAVEAQTAIVRYGGDTEFAADRIRDIIASKLGTTTDNVAVIESRIRDLTATLNTAPDPWLSSATYTPAPTQTAATPTTTGPQPAIG